jgi:hypothetical protein
VQRKLRDKNSKERLALQIIRDLVSESQTGKIVVKDLNI